MHDSCKMMGFNWVWILEGRYVFFGNLHIYQIIQIHLHESSILSPADKINCYYYFLLWSERYEPGFHRHCSALPQVTEGCNSRVFFCVTSCSLFRANVCRDWDAAVTGTFDYLYPTPRRSSPFSAPLPLIHCKVADCSLSRTHHQMKVLDHWKGNYRCWLCRLPKSWMECKTWDLFFFSLFKLNALL